MKTAQLAAMAVDTAIQDGTTLYVKIASDVWSRITPGHGPEHRMSQPEVAGELSEDAVVVRGGR